MAFLTLSLRWGKAAKLPYAVLKSRKGLFPMALYYSFFLSFSPSPAYRCPNPLGKLGRLVSLWWWALPLGCGTGLAEATCYSAGDGTGIWETPCLQGRGRDLTTIPSDPLILQRI